MSNKILQDAAIVQADMINWNLKALAGGVSTEQLDIYRDLVQQNNELITAAFKHAQEEFVRQLPVQDEDDTDDTDDTDDPIIISDAPLDEFSVMLRKKLEMRDNGITGKNIIQFPKQ